MGRLTLIDLVNCAEYLRSEKRKVYDDALNLFARMGADAGDLAKDAFRMRADDVMLDPEDFFGWIRSPEGVVHLLRVGISKCLVPVDSLSENPALDATKRDAQVNEIISKVGVDVINQWQMFVAESFATDRWEGVQESAEKLMELLYEIPENLQQDIVRIAGFVQGTSTQA